MTSLFKSTNAQFRLKGSNYSQSQIDRILSIVMAPSGALLYTGPTGSGKTTLLDEIWKEKARSMPGRRLVTIEQPAELIMPWAIQMDIPNTADAEEAARLLPVLCQCAVPWSSSDSRMSHLSCEAVPSWCDDLSHVRQVGPGCAACSGTGYIGRTVVAEVVETDERLMNDVIMLGVSRARHRYRSRPDADPSMLETAMVLVARGVVDPFDVNTRVERIRPKDVVLEERHLGARD